MEKTKIGKEYKLQPNPSTLTENDIRRMGAEAEESVVPEIQADKIAKDEAKRIAALEKQAKATRKAGQSTKEESSSDRIVVEVDSGDMNYLQRQWAMMIAKSAAIRKARAEHKLVVDSGGRIIANFTGQVIIDAEPGEVTDVSETPSRQPAGKAASGTGAEVYDSLRNHASTLPGVVANTGRKRALLRERIGRGQSTEPPTEGLQTNKAGSPKKRM